MINYSYCIMWKPVYEYKLTKWKWSLIALLGYPPLAFLMVLIEEKSVLLIIVGGVLVLSSIICIYLVASKPQKVRNVLRQNNIEFYEKTAIKNMWFVKNSVNLIGLFDHSKRTFVLPADYTEITSKGNYLFIKKKGKFGVVNLSINTEIVPCEYDKVAYNEKSGSICCMKGHILYDISPYGTIIKEYGI